MILDLKLTVTIPVGVGGSSFSDLILTDFLDKFMEKKPKQNTWHSGSQIEPSKKDDYLNGVLDFTRTSGDCELKTADSFHCSPLHLWSQTKDSTYYSNKGCWALDFGMWWYMGFVFKPEFSKVRQELRRPQGRMFTRVAQYKPLMFIKALLS